MTDKNIIFYFNRCYEVGFTALAEFCVDRFEKTTAEQAVKDISEFLDKFYNTGTYLSILPHDREKINNLVKEYKEGL